MDPQFLANLQKLGPVAVDTPGEFMRAVSLRSGKACLPSCVTSRPAGEDAVPGHVTSLTASLHAPREHSQRGRRSTPIPL